tara:strand:- start:247 stop:498 length:252 start_codon:yes stop_codon:yes gene_type:complete
MTKSAQSCLKYEDTINLAPFQIRTVNGEPALVDTRTGERYYEWAMNSRYGLEWGYGSSKKYLMRFLRKKRNEMNSRHGLDMIL